MKQIQSEKFNKAFGFHQQGKLTPARDLYMEILKDEPLNHEVWDLLGLLYSQVKDFLEAEVCIKKAISIQPELYYFENLAGVYLQKGDYELAIDFYKELTTQCPNRYEYWFYLAMAYKNHHDWELAKEAYLLVLKRIVFPEQSSKVLLVVAPEA